MPESEGETYGATVRCRCSIVSAAEGNAHSLSGHSRPHLHVGGHILICQVGHLDAPIRPGESGNVVLSVIADIDPRLVLEVGAEFALRTFAQEAAIAHCRVLHVQVA